MYTFRPFLKKKRQRKKKEKKMVSEIEECKPWLDEIFGKCQFATDAKILREEPYCELSIQTKQRIRDMMRTNKDIACQDMSYSLSPHKKELRIEYPVGFTKHDCQKSKKTPEELKVCEFEKKQLRQMNVTISRLLQLYEQVDPDTRKKLAPVYEQLIYLQRDLHLIRFLRLDENLIYVMKPLLNGNVAQDVILLNRMKNELAELKARLKAKVPLLERAKHRLKSVLK